MDFNLNLIGMVAGTLTVIAFLPQLFKVHKSKSARDLSWIWIAGFFSGIFLWIIYGVLNSSLPIILANGAMFMLGIVLIGLKWSYER